MADLRRSEYLDFLDAASDEVVAPHLLPPRLILSAAIVEPDLSQTFYAQDPHAGLCVRLRGESHVTARPTMERWLRLNGYRLRIEHDHPNTTDYRRG